MRRLADAHLASPTDVCCRAADGRLLSDRRRASSTHGPMKNLFQDGIDCFNAAAWYDAHEVWEDLWNETQGEARLFYQGLIQIAVGLHHLSHGNLRGGRRVLERGARKLADYPEDYGGIDNKRLQRDLEFVLSQSALPPVRIHSLEPSR